MCDIRKCASKKIIIKNKMNAKEARRKAELKDLDKIFSVSRVNPRIDAEILRFDKLLEEEVEKGNFSMEFIFDLDKFGNKFHSDILYSFLRRLEPRKFRIDWIPPICRGTIMVHWARIYKPKDNWQ